MRDGSAIYKLCRILDLRHRWRPQQARDHPPGLYGLVDFAEISTALPSVADTDRATERNWQCVLSQQQSADLVCAGSGPVACAEHTDYPVLVAHSSWEVEMRRRRHLLHLQRARHARRWHGSFLAKSAHILWRALASFALLQISMPELVTHITQLRAIFADSLHRRCLPIRYAGRPHSRHLSRTVCTGTARFAATSRADSNRLEPPRVRGFVRLPLLAFVSSDSVDRER
jgi:hypothetical protein